MTEEQRDGEPCWVDWVPEEDRPPRPIRAYGPSGQRSLPRPDLIPAPRELDPADAIWAQEYQGLMGRSDALWRTDPAQARELLERAESIVPGTVQRMQASYLWDPITDRPLVVTLGGVSHLIPRDRRLAKGRVG